MRHEWILDVLTNLLSYSERNGLQGLAVQVEDALRAARTEVDAVAPVQTCDDISGDGSGMRRQ